MVKILIYIFFLFTASVASAQTCDKLQRKLFYMLPDEVPDTINCRDASGKKQGWWIYYKVLNNPPDRFPDPYRPKGDYVQTYYYGKYKDGRRVGKWVDMYNVHLVGPTSTNEYVYSGDTMRVMTTILTRRDTFSRTYIGDSVINDYFKKYYSN